MLVTIKYTSNIFTLKHPGIKILIPYYFESISKILFTEYFDFEKKSRNTARKSIINRLIEVNDFDNSINEVKSSALDCLKSIFVLTIEFDMLQIPLNLTNDFILLGHYKKYIIDLIIKYLEFFNNSKKKNKLALEFRNNLYSTIFLIIQHMNETEEDRFEVKSLKN